MHLYIHQNHRGRRSPCSISTTLMLLHHFPLLDDALLTILLIMQGVIQHTKLFKPSVPGSESKVNEKGNPILLVHHKVQPNIFVCAVSKLQYRKWTIPSLLLFCCVHPQKVSFRSTLKHFSVSWFQYYLQSMSTQLIYKKTLMLTANLTGNLVNLEVDRYVSESPAAFCLSLYRCWYFTKFPSIHDGNFLYI